MTQNKQYIEQHKNTKNNTKNTLNNIKITKSAGHAPSLRVLLWHLPYNWGKSTEKPSVKAQKNLSQSMKKPQSEHRKTSMPHCMICNGSYIPSLTFYITSKPVHHLTYTAYRGSEGDSVGHQVNVGTNRYSTPSCTAHESVDIPLYTVFKFITSIHLLPPLIHCHKLQWTDSGTILKLNCVTKPILWTPLTKLIQPLLGTPASLQSAS